MSKIILINSSFTQLAREFSNFGPPLGILSIASSLCEAGYDVLFVDPQLETDYLKILEEALCDDILFIGFSVYLGENIANTIELTKHIKNSHRNIPIVWGGPIASALPEICLREGGADYVVMGPGERSVVELAGHLQENNGIKLQEHPHISLIMPDDSYKQGEIHRLSENLDDMPRIRLDLWRKGVDHSKTVPLISSRGCPYKCSFCYNTFTNQGRYLLRSSESVIAEMDYWHQLFGNASFTFMDDNFLINEKRALDILRTSEERGYNVTRVYGHLSNFTPAVRKIICDKKINVTMCIESGSKKIRNLLNKPIDIDKSLQLIEQLTSCKVTFVTAFMFGLPGEDDEDILESLKVANSIRKVSAGYASSMFYLYAPQPNDLIINSGSNCYSDKIDFTFNSLSGVEVIPIPPTDGIDLKLRPWMNAADTDFYKALAMAWLYTFVPQYRRKHSDLNLEQLFANSTRLSNLFKTAGVVNE